MNLPILGTLHNHIPTMSFEPIMKMNVGGERVKWNKNQQVVYNTNILEAIRLRKVNCKPI